MNIKGAIFDMDGTLIDSLSFWGRLWEKIGEKYFSNRSFTPAAEVDKAVRTMIFKDAMTYFKSYYGINAGDDEFIGFCEEWVPEFYKTVATLKSGASELLEYLKNTGVKICLASASSRDVIDLALEYHGIADLFDFTISCAELGVGKEKPDIYLEALRLIGTNAKDTAVFEDSPVALATARSVGLKTVGIFDKHNVGIDELRRISDIFVEENQSLFTLSMIINA